MTADEFRKELDDLGFSQVAFARLTGVNDRTVRRWAAGSAEIPQWVGVTTGLFRRVLDAEAKAKAPKVQTFD